MVVNIDHIWRITADLVEMGRRDDAEAVKKLKDEYIKLRSVYLFDSSRILPSGIEEECQRLNAHGTPVGDAERQAFVQWDLNKRADKYYAIERGSAVEWQWAQFVINGGAVTQAMVEHAASCDPEGWKKAISDAEEE